MSAGSPCAPPTPAVEGRESPHDSCRHCGAALLDDRMRTTGFCCAGCNYVHRLVHEQGLAAYYQIKDNLTAPADAAVFEARDYTWLTAAQREAEIRANAVPELVLKVQGV